MTPEVEIAIPGAGVQSEFDCRDRLTKRCSLAPSGTHGAVDGGHVTSFKYGVRKGTLPLYIFHNNCLIDSKLYTTCQLRIRIDEVDYGLL